MFNPEAKIIDSHAHLDYPYDASVEEMLAAAAAKGVSHVVTIAAEPDSLERARDIAAKYPNVFHTSGIHPHDAVKLDDSVFERVKSAAQSPKCVAVGEIGLDYFYEESPREVQIRSFQLQLNYSVEIGKPIVVHARDADEDMIEQLRPHASAFAAAHPHTIPGIIHCFTSSQKLAEAALGMGYFISFSGIITFKNAEPLRQIVRDVVPLERMLIETDAPFLAPVPYRGKPNKPEHTIEVAKKVAELKGVSYEEVARVTRANTIRIFRLPITLA